MRLSGSSLLLCLAYVAGCDGSPAVDAGTDGGFVFDAGVIDAGPPCTFDLECDDEIPCTIDTCEDRRCRNTADQTVCDDGVFCNGAERCDLEEGCLPGTRETCNDENVCTLDRCDEAGRSCEYSPRDLDEDGDPDFFCDGGDCDDRNATVSSLREEICDDGIDNDCDGMDDEADCGAPPHDTCDDALDVSAGGFFAVSTTGAIADYPTSCGGTSRDVVLTFTLDEPRSVSIEADGEFFTVALSVQGECGSSASELGCSAGFPALVRKRTLGPGTYFAVIATNATGEIGIDVELGEPMPPVPNETCGEAITISGTGGTFTGNFIDARDDVHTSCGSDGATDVFYTLDLEADSDVVIRAQALTGEPLNYSVRTVCTDEASELRCDYGSPVGGRIHQLPVGRYTLVLEGPTYAVVEYSLTVEITDPTPAPIGDSCATAIPLELGTAYAGTLVAFQDDLRVSCGYEYVDAVHTFTLTETSDVTIDLDAGSSAILSTRTTCEDEATALRCSSDIPVRQRLFSLGAGIYYLVVEAPRARPYSITVTATVPATPIVDVSGNEDCNSPHDVPITGGLFRGNTTDMRGDYTTGSVCFTSSQGNDAVFRLTLTEPVTHVVASSDASSFDTVLHVHHNVCSSDDEVHCDDSSGDRDTGIIDENLGPGEWFIVVDGYNAAAKGEYLLEVLVSPP
jgi:hypothetical protein